MRILCHILPVHQNHVPLPERLTQLPSHLPPASLDVIHLKYHAEMLLIYNGAVRENPCQGFPVNGDRSIRIRC